MKRLKSNSHRRELTEKEINNLAASPWGIENLIYNTKALQATRNKTWDPEALRARDQFDYMISPLRLWRIAKS